MVGKYMCYDENYFNKTLKDGMSKTMSVYVEYPKFAVYLKFSYNKSFIYNLSF